MSFSVHMSNVLVGRSDLEQREPGAHRATGAFRPGLGYELAQPVFALYDPAADAPTLERYRSARDALRLELRTASGTRVPVRELHIRAIGGGHDAGTGLVLEVESDEPIP